MDILALGFSTGAFLKPKKLTEALICLRLCLFPAMHRIVAEGHVIRVVTVIPPRMAVGEKYVLALAMNPPFLPIKNAIGRTTDTVLRIIILVGIGLAALVPNRVAGQHKSRRELNSFAVHRSVIVRYDCDVSGTGAVEIIEWRLLVLGKELVRRAAIGVCVLNVRNDLFHPACRMRMRISLPPSNAAAGFGIKPARLVRINHHAETDLMQVGIAGNRPRALLGRRERRQQHRRQSRDDGNDDEQFDQRERPRTFFIFGKNNHAKIKTRLGREGFNFVWRAETIISTGATFEPSSSFSTSPNPDPARRIGASSPPPERSFLHCPCARPQTPARRTCHAGWTACL